MGWHKPKAAARYCGVSESTLRMWIRENNLRYSRLPSGAILIRESWLDDFLMAFEFTREINADQVSEQILEDLKK